LEGQDAWLMTVVVCCRHGSLSHIRAGGWIRRDPRFLKLVRRLQSLLKEAPDTFKPQELANAINGLAKLGHHPGKVFMERFTDECLRRDFKDFNAHDLANVTNGLAKLEYDPGEAFLKGFTDKCSSTELERDLHASGPRQCDQRFCQARVRPG
jgi:hypothetical protein